MRVMNWNIEQLSNAKLNIPGMATAIARTVVAANVDILIVLEVKMTMVHNAMQTLSAALNFEEGAGANPWTGYFLSRQTGGEFYCIFIRDLDLVRPVAPQAGIGPTGQSNDPLRDLKRNVFRIWPSANFGVTAYPVGVGKPWIPLCDFWARRPNQRGGGLLNFGGQQLGGAGYALGRGFRMPALALFWVHTLAGNDYLLPFVVCHYGAVRGRRQRNILAQSQVFQLMYLHIARLFTSDAFGAGVGGYLDVLNAAGGHRAVRVQELCFTGDFNLDFLQNANGGTYQQLMNRNAYDGLTPTVQNGGSAAPAALPGAPGPPPVLPWGPPWPQAPSTDAINQQRLKAAVTTQGTMQRQWPLAIPPPGAPPPAPYADAAFDNFFYGGTQLSGAAVLAAPDAGQARNVPASITQAAPPGAGLINVAPVAAHYTLAGTKNAVNAPSLQTAGLPMFAPLIPDDRLIGSRLVSDHLPVVLQFALP